jgi:O-antigen/teichoic acid export membrane protein
MSMASVAVGPVDLRRAVLGNLLSSMGETGMRFVLGLVLARLLLAADLGLFALAMAVFGIAQLLRDAGITAYLQRERDLTPARFSTCLGLLFCTTLATTLALILLAEPLADQLAQPGLAALLRWLALLLPLSAFSSVIVALQLRALAAARIAWMSWLALSVQALVSIVCCTHGAGALGLVWGQLATALVCGLAHLGMRPPGLRWRPALNSSREVLGFAAGALLPTALNSLHGLLPDLLLGRLGGAHALGLFGRAQATVSLLQALAGRALTFGALPVLAERHARAQALEPALRRATALLTGLGWPLLALTVIHRGPLIDLLYGPAWRDCVPAVPPLALVAALGLAFNQLGSGLAAVGRPELAAAPMAVVLAARVGLVLTCFDGSVVSFAWAMAAAACAALPLQLALSARYLGQAPQALAAALGGSAVAALAVSLVPPALAPLALLAALRLCRHPLLDELARLARWRTPRENVS